MRLFPPRRWRWGFPRRLGASSGGGRALTKPCPRALPRCGYDQLRETGSWRRLIRSNGSSSNGLRAKKSRQNLARRHAHPRPRQHVQITLAHRARLRGIEKRTRPRPFRGAKLARLPSPRSALRRSLWLPDPRTSGDSPLRLPVARNISPIPASQTPRRRRPDPSGISKTRSPPSDDRSQSYWLEPSCVAHAAKQCDQNNRTADRRDAVELGGRKL